MKRTRQKIAIVSSVLLCLIVAPQVKAHKEVRTIRKLNDGWSFVSGSRENAKWQSVTIPHTWNVEDTLDDEPGYRRGVSWYRRELKLDKPRFPDERTFLQFEGVGQVAEVFVNDKLVGKHIGGYTAFSFEITEFLKTDAVNVIDISVDNTLILDNTPIDGDFNMYGGIYRDVWLIRTRDVRLATTDVAGNGIAITTPEVSTALGTIDIRGSVINSSKGSREVEVTSLIFDPSGKQVTTSSSTVRIEPNGGGSFQQTVKIPKPMLWSPDAPNLYSIQTTLREKGKVLDQVTNPLGFRWFKFDAENGFFLNGKHLKLRGTNRHQDIAGMANAVPDNLHARDMRIIKENGYNFVRLAHYPQDPSVLEAADQLGLIIWEEIPIINKIHISETFNANAKSMLREMIRQHRNHPSIVMWGYMNEIFLRVPKDDKQIPPATVNLARELENICRTEDPDRVTVIAFDGGARDLYYSSDLVNVTQVVGWNLYSGWYSATFEDFSKFVDEFHRKYPNRPVIISEFGANADRRVHAVTPKRFDSSIEWQQKFHEYYLHEIEARPFISGSAIWNQFDFGSEFRGETIPHINQKGMYTYDRQPKDVSYFYRASYRSDPVLHIAVGDWPKRSGPKTQTVVVYTNLDRVELFNNGVSLGVVAVADKKATWSVNFSPGNNKLRATGRVGTKPVSDDAVVEYVDPMSTDLIAINCGANTEVIDAAGVIWQADVPMPDPRAWSVTERDSKTVDTRVNILGTPDDAIFQTMREGASSYKFNVPDGRYEIEFRFAEPKFKKVLERIFSIKINGLLISDKVIDVFAEAGYMTEFTEKVRMTVSGGSGIQIEFVPITNLPVVSGIKLKRIDQE